MGSFLTQWKRWQHCGGSILDKYSVKLMSHAVNDLDSIYEYIAGNLLEPEVALELQIG